MKISMCNLLSCGVGEILVWGIFEKAIIAGSVHVLMEDKIWTNTGFSSLNFQFHYVPCKTKQKI